MKPEELEEYALDNVNLEVAIDKIEDELKAKRIGRSIQTIYVNINAYCDYTNILVEKFRKDKYTVNPIKSYGEMDPGYDYFLEFKFTGKNNST